MYVQLCLYDTEWCLRKKKKTSVTVLAYRPTYLRHKVANAPGQSKGRGWNKCDEGACTVSPSWFLYSLSKYHLISLDCRQQMATDSTQTVRTWQIHCFLWVSRLVRGEGSALSLHFASAISCRVWLLLKAMRRFEKHCSITEGKAKDCFPWISILLVVFDSCLLYTCPDSTGKLERSSKCKVIKASHELANTRLHLHTAQRVLLGWKQL